jgi:HK97 family phage major capsid protein
VVLLALVPGASLAVPVCNGSGVVRSVCNRSELGLEQSLAPLSSRMRSKATTMMNETEFSQFRTERREACALLSLDDLSDRRAQLATRKDQLAEFAHRSHPQDEEMESATAEVVVLDELIGERRTLERSAKVEAGRRAMADPANREGPDGPQSARTGSPAFVRGQLGTRLETADETIQRMGNPWRDEGGPLNRETAAGFVSRANTALEGLSERLTPAGAELLSSLLSERRDTRGVSVRRSADEVRQGAEMILALSSPHYESAMRSVFRNPDLFRTGIGAMVWSDDEREAMHAAMNNELVRAAFAESSGATGSFALPLQLDSTIMFTNAGIASPHRSLARHEIGTSNTWNGIVSQGATANWVAEGTAVTDTTPSIGQLVITPSKQMTWIYGSFEVLDDTSLSEQVPELFNESRGRLEGTAFAIGTGSGQPFGAVTRAGADSTAGALTAAMIYNLDQNLPPRFRNGGKVAWTSNESIRNVARQVAKFTGAVESIVNDNTADGIPEMLGYDFYESSAMLGGTTGNRELLLGDWQSYIIVDRLPNVVIAEPLVAAGTSPALPTGQRGWLAYSRVGADTVTQGAAFGSNAFVVHVH